MKISRLALVVLATTFAFGALSAASASAVTFLLALWLWKGTALTESLGFEVEGQILLEDKKGNLFGGPAAVLCSWIMDGTINPESLGYISELLTLTKELIELNTLVELGLECSPETECPIPLVWAYGLPWETEVELVEEPNEGPFFAMLILPREGLDVGWLVQCMGIIGEPEDECFTPAEWAFQLTLEGTNLLATTSELFRELVGAPLFTCINGGANSSEIQSDEGALVKHETGGELTASSEASEA
jgi:hypothetical protein